MANMTGLLQVSGGQSSMAGSLACIFLALFVFDFKEPLGLPASC